MATDDESETVDEKVARLVAEQLASADADRTKAEKLKKLGVTPDLLDVIADAVWDRGEARAAARNKAEEDADQAPTTGKGGRKGSFLQNIGLAANDD